MKCPNALNTQSKCGETFLGNCFFQILKSWKKNFKNKGKLQQQNIPNDFTFWHDQDDFFFKNQK